MANRKLQAEIDKVLKRVSEGIVDFEETFEKLYAATNANQKEKLEQDLKKEIKKLQRLRDQIKTWLSSNDIKDKRQLLDARKAIETEMERFKACEREMKTKQYSKEGLQAKEKLDPAEVAKAEAAQWITGAVDRLSTQIDALEAESEQIHAKKRGTRADNDRLKVVESFVEKHKFHTGKLETMLRLLENDAITVDDVDTVKDYIDYYIDSNQDPDFQSDDEIYDHLELNEDDLAPFYDDVPETAVKEEDIKKDEQPKKRPSKDEGETSPTKTMSNRSSMSSKTNPSSSKPMKTTALPPPLPPPKNTLTQKYSAVATPETKPISSKPNSAGSSGPEPDVAKSKPIETAPLPKNFAAAAAAPLKTTNEKTAVENKAPSTPKVSHSTVTKSESHIDTSTREPKKAFQVTATLPESFADLLATYEAAKMKSYGKGDEIARNPYLLQVVDASLNHCPDMFDSERPSVFVPSYPAKLPPYYPTTPIAFNTPSAFEKVDIDTLFFIFYYQQGTTQQNLAARELKRQSWRFHKKYLTWFQRHEEPKMITDEYEQGTYIYFDYEGAWCQRKKTEFTFEYRFLEDE